VGAKQRGEPSGPNAEVAAPPADYEPVQQRLIPKLPIVVRPLAALTVKALPLMKKLVKERFELPGKRIINVGRVDGNFVVQSKAVPAMSVRTEFPAADLLNTDCRGREVQFKLDVEALGPEVKKIGLLAVCPIVGADGMLPQRFIDRFNRATKVQFRRSATSHALTCPTSSM
jgi:hypothetical protein